MFDNQVSHDFFRWIREGKTGCLFAKMLALKADDPWESVVIYGARFDISLHTTLNDHLNRATRYSGAIQFLFPQIKSPEEIVDLIKILCKNPDWRCSEIKPKEGEFSSTFLIGLRWKLPDSKHINWVLGFADLDSMPLTRRSPSTALILRLGPPGRAPAIAKSKPNEIALRQPEDGLVPVHLADLSMPTNLADDGIKKMWEKTEKATESLLGHDMEVRSTAHAKITFSLPPELRATLEDVLSAA